MTNGSFDNEKITMLRLKKFNPTRWLLTLALVLSGCELLGPDLKSKLELQPVKVEPDSVPTEQVNLVEEPQSAVPSYAKPEFYTASNHRSDNQALKKNNKVKQTQGIYSLNFENADLSEVVKVILGDILNENYLLAPDVKGSVTIQTSKPLTKQELIPTLDMLLRMNKAALSKTGRHYFIEPMTRANQGSTLSAKGTALPAGYQIRVIPVKYVDATNISELLKPLVYEKTILNVDETRNLLMVAGTGSELERVQEIVDTFDVHVLKDRSFGLFPLMHVTPDEIITELESIFSQKNNANSKSGHIQFMNIDRLNAIMAVTHQEQYLKDVEQWVIRLDRANSTSGGGINVYKAQHVDAVKLADTLNDIFSGGQQKQNQPKVAPGLKPISITNAQKKNEPAEPVNLTPAMVSDISKVGDVRVIADEANNSVIIVANAQDYAVIRSVITQLDVMPLQVLIDATIVSVTLTDDLQYGIKWYFEHNSGRSLATSGGADGGALRGFGQLAADAAANVASGFAYSFVPSSGKLRAKLDALASKDKIDVIASPSLMVLNNQEASIQVGDEVPIRTSESTNTSGSIDPIQTSSIQMRETGVSLNVKPRVNANGLVIMDIEQSVDRAIPAGGTSSIDSPTIQQRKVNSQVAVQSGETIVLGGLIDENNTRTSDGIPFLSDIPLIGAFFGSTGKTLTRTELVILITPRVVKSRQDARLITDEFKRKLTGIYQEPAATKVVEN